jgi:hypothetical protein
VQLTALEFAPSGGVASADGRAMTVVDPPPFVLGDPERACGSHRPVFPTAFPRGHWPSPTLPRGWGLRRTRRRLQHGAILNEMNKTQLRIPNARERLCQG